MHIAFSFFLFNSSSYAECRIERGFESNSWWIGAVRFRFTEHVTLDHRCILTWSCQCAVHVIFTLMPKSWAIPCWGSFWFSLQNALEVFGPPFEVIGLICEAYKATDVVRAIRVVRSFKNYVAHVCCYFSIFIIKLYKNNL